MLKFVSNLLGRPQATGGEQSGNTEDESPWTVDTQIANEAGKGQVANETGKGQSPKVEDRENKYDEEIARPQPVTSALEEQIEKLREELAEKHVELQIAHDASYKADHIQRQTQDKLQRITAKHEKLKKAMLEKGQLLKDDGENRIDEVAHLQTTNSTLEKQVARLEGELAKESQVARGALEDRNNKGKEVARLQAVNSVLNEQIAKLREDQLRAANDALEDRDNKIKEVARLQAANSALEKQVAKLREERSRTARDALKDKDNRSDEAARLLSANFTLEQQVTNLQGELAKKQAAHDALQGKGKRFQEELVKKDEDLKVARRALEDMDNKFKEETARLLAVNSALEKQIASIQQEAQHDDFAMDQLNAQLARAQIERRRLDQLLKARTAELNSVHVFLRKVDNISETEVSRMVELLNADIFQLSSLISDSLTQRKGSEYSQANHAEFKNALNYVELFIGKRLKDELAQNVRNRSPSTLSETVLQSGLVNACALVIQEWNPPAWGSFSNVENVYRAMRSSEGQAIAGRWRALAHTYISVQSSKNEIRTKSAEFLKEVLRGLLIVVDWPAYIPTPPRYEERIDIIAKKAIDIWEAIGKGITSADLQAHAILFDEHFSPDLMEDAYGEEDNGPVLCTTELGLRRSENPSDTSDEQRKNETILKPKVLLVSALEEIRQGANF